MFGVFLTLHIIICLFLIFIVLLQSGRGAELGAAFGSMGQATYSRGNMGPVGKMTTVAAILFMLTSLVLAYLSSENAVSSVVEQAPTVPAASVVPAIPSTELEIPADLGSPQESETESRVLIEQLDALPIENEASSSTSTNVEAVETNQEEKSLPATK